MNKLQTVAKPNYLPYSARVVRGYTGRMAQRTTRQAATAGERKGITGRKPNIRHHLTGIHVGRMATPTTSRKAQEQYA